jgi:hypothetical protein
MTATSIRCSDAEREQTAARLRDAAAEGRLSMEELEERLGSVYAAKYHHELDPLVTDLPRPPAPAATTGWRPILTAAWAQLIGAGSGWTRRRLVLAAIVLLVLAGAVVAAFHGFGAGGFEHHGFENGGFDGPGRRGP